MSMISDTSQERLHWLTLLALAGVVLVSGCAATSELRQADIENAAESRLILITVRQADGMAAGLIGAPGKRYLRRQAYGPLPSVDRTLNQIVREYGLERVEGWPIASLDVYCEVLEVPAAIAIERLIADLRSDPRVDIAQRMNFFDTLAIEYDDPYVDLQSSLARMNIREAHAVATGRNVLVAVIDSAVETRHPDLRGRVRLNRNFVDRRYKARAGEVHGTAVAGVIASMANNGEGIVGVAPDATLAALRACWSISDAGSASRCSSFSLAQALELAMELAPSVINLSLAGPADPLLSQLLDQIIQRGIVVVAADPASPDHAGGFPTSNPKVLAVRMPAASIQADARLRLAAPGDEILTTTPEATYGFLSGNSLAAAHVTGVVALLKERVPSLDTDQIAALFAAMVADASESRSINACRALQRLDAAISCAH